MCMDFESTKVKYSYFIKRLGHQEMGSRQSREDKSHRGRYFLIPKSATDFFPLHCDYQLNDMAFICLTPLYPTANGASRPRCYYAYVYHNSKHVLQQRNGRDEHRIYLSLNFDDGLAFDDDIIIMRRRLKSETGNITDTSEMTDEERSFDNSSALKAGFDYFIDWIRKDKHSVEWDFFDRMLKEANQGGRNASSTEVTTFIPFFESKVQQTFTDSVQVDQKIVASFDVADVHDENSLNLQQTSETTSDQSIEDLNDQALAKFAHLFNSVSFRDFVLTTYGNTCAITGQVISYGPFNNLEAAHINPRCHGGYYLPQNGIAMRRDIHWAFDKGMFFVDPQTLEIHVHEAVRHCYLGAYDGKKITPLVQNFAPHPKYLEYHKQKIYGSFLHTGALNKLV